MRIANLSTKSGSMSSSDKFVTDNGTTVTKIDYNALAKAIIEQYTGSSLAGSAQSVKAALDALNSNSGGVTFTSTTVNASGQTAISVPSNYRGVLFTSASSSACNGVYMVFCTGSGTITMNTIREASGITFSLSANEMQISPSQQTKVVFLNMAGSTQLK